MEVFFSLINSSVFRKFVMAPLAVIGFYQIFRGVTTIMEKDISEHHLSGWILITYIAVTALGCLCLVVAL